MPIESYLFDLDGMRHDSNFGPAHVQVDLGRDLHAHLIDLPRSPCYNTLVGVYISLTFLTFVPASDHSPISKTRDPTGVLSIT
jgi:hypothetical protein